MHRETAMKSCARVWAQCCLRWWSCQWLMRCDKMYLSPIPFRFMVVLVYLPANFSHLNSTCQLAGRRGGPGWPPGSGRSDSGCMCRLSGGRSRRSQSQWCGCCCFLAALVGRSPAGREVLSGKSDTWDSKSLTTCKARHLWDTWVEDFQDRGL